VPKIVPFRAVTYDIARVGSLDAVVAPPYDAIDAALQEECYRRSPYNIVRVTRGKDLPGGDGARESRYRRAAGPLKALRRTAARRGRAAAKPKARTVRRAPKRRPRR
jgi:uncharacterized protein (DUF1015 family)